MANPLAGADSIRPDKVRLFSAVFDHAGHPQGLLNGSDRVMNSELPSARSTLLLGQNHCSAIDRQIGTGLHYGAESCVIVFVDYEVGVEVGLDGCRL